MATWPVQPEPELLPSLGVKTNKQINITTRNILIDTKVLSTELNPHGLPSLQNLNSYLATPHAKIV